MDSTINLTQSLHEVQAFLLAPNAYRSVLILSGSIIVAYLASKYLAAGIIKIAQAVSAKTETESNEERYIRLRQVETYLSVAVAGVRAVVVSIVAYITWRLLSPASNSSVAAIGASAIFVVFAGQTLGTLLRDLTAGSIMIIEQWFNVGDYIKIEPFIHLAGVVERLTLRSTKLRSLSGEVLWVHNQQIQAVHVTPKGVKTIAVDVFVPDKIIGERTLKKLIKAIPTGPTMLAQPLHITTSEKWADDLWHITVTGKTAPGREWLIETFFVNMIKDSDKGKPRKDRTFVYDPIAHYADPIADKKFSRAVRLHR